MKRSIVLATFLSASLYAEGLEEAFENATHDGYIRAGFQHQDEGELSIGGKLHMQTAPVNGISFGTSFYTTQGVDKKYNNGINFFSSDKHSYSILGEAYLQADIKNSSVKIGRQELDTPYADTDDIGIIPNTFEAITLSNNSFIDTTIFAGYLRKMSGVDSDKAEKFNTINDVYNIGLTYEGFKDIDLTLWYYDAEKLAKITYFETGYKKKFTNFNFDFDFQYSNQNFYQAAEVDIYGANFAVTKDLVTLNVAYNKVNSTDGQVADNFFGGGPFFINCEHDTIAEIGANGEGYRVGLEIDMSDYIVNDLGISVNYLDGKGDNKDINEIDIVANYEISDNLTFDFIYSDATDNLDDKESFKNSRFFINYSF